jgi:hypothetical protein
MKLFGDFKWVLYLSAITAGCAAWCITRLVLQIGGSRFALHAAGLTIALLPNSLGLSAQIMTDAIAGHLTVVWVYLLVNGCRKASAYTLGFASAILVVLQSFKPTFNIAGILIPLAVLLYGSRSHRIVASVILIVLSVAFPMYLAQRNLEAHGVRSASLLGVEALREYLQVRYLHETTGEDYERLQDSVFDEDTHDAQRLATPSSFYGRLYLVRAEKVRRFLFGHPLTALRLMLTEMGQQLAAPQELFPQVFIGDLPQWGRALGSLLTLALWGCAVVGGYCCWMKGNWRAAVLPATVLAFLLVTGSISHRVGARLRFPGDIAAIPLAAVGMSRLVGRETVDDASGSVS